ncbi:helix-turn-helix domain-containing protein [Acidovorax sp.]|uniref:helix-turn-helix domain-containing protein n=1 Tax=Acidovorax sp. TaxID=1872122 RepID=UPI00391F8789
MSTTDTLKNRLDLSRLVELDCQLREFAVLRNSPAPRSGWIKAVRLALGMTAPALARRINISPQGLRQLEQSEVDGSISLNTLSRIAAGLDCEVRYVLIPRTSLVDQLLNRFLESGKASLVSESHTMRSGSGSGDNVVTLAALLEQRDLRSLW